MLDEAQSHYLAHVMRVREGDRVAVFNGQDGQWEARIASVAKKKVGLLLERQILPQRASPDLWLVFAPIKNKTDLVVEKAVELGVSAIGVVYTKHAVVRSVNAEKLMRHAIEAAEQCERFDVPSLTEYKDMGAFLGAWPKDRTLLYGDESGAGVPFEHLLSGLEAGKYAVLIGPEGGFSKEEHRMLQAHPQVKPFGMGPRILRADTAAVAALACVQARLGDWDERPHFVAEA